MAETKEFFQLRVYQLSEQLADHIWKTVLTWNHFSRDTVGKQIVRAADGIGANIAEGAARRSFADNRRFIRIARGSLNETRHWLRRASTRKLLLPEDGKTLHDLVFQLQPVLNAYLRSIGTGAIPKQ